MLNIIHFQQINSQHNNNNIYKNMQKNLKILKILNKRIKIQKVVSA